MNRYIFLLQFFTVLSLSTLAQTREILQDEYAEVEKFFNEFYDTNFTTPNLTDNGYFTSELWMLNSNEATKILDTELTIDTKIDESIQASLLTKFAYAKPSEAEKTRFTKLIRKFLYDGKYRLFSSSLNSSQILSRMPLTTSCFVAGPEKPLIVVHAKELDKQNTEFPIVYVIQSDVCD